MGKSLKKVLKVGVLFMLLISLAVGIAVPVSADNSNSAPTGIRILQGVVQSVASPNFTIKNGDQTPITVNTDASTQYFIIPAGKVKNSGDDFKIDIKKEDRREAALGIAKAAQLKNFQIPANWKSNFGWLEIFDHDAQFSDIAVGDRVIVRAQTSTNLAKQVLIIKAPVNRSIKGVISAVTANTISITPNGGTTAIVMNVTPATRVMLKGITIIAAGQSATAVYNSSNNNALTINIQPAPDDD